MISNIGVIGAGIIGKPMAERLIQAGFHVFVHDVRDEPVQALARMGATACGSSAEVAAASELVLSLVLDTPQTEDVIFGPRGVLHAIKPGSIFAIGSTLGPAPVVRVAEALARKECETLDMAITGGYPAAYEGKLTLMIGGTEETLARAAPALQTFANVIIRAGGVGAGQAAKVAHQLTMGINILALLEGLSLGVAGGVDARVLKQILGHGIADSKVLAVWEELGPRWKAMLAPTAPGVPLPNLRKDLHTALDLARALGVNLELGREASRIADAGTAIGHDNPAL